MSRPVVEWRENVEAGELQYNERRTGTAEGGPHVGPLNERQRLMYRFGFFLVVWMEAVLLVTLFALKLVYAGSGSRPPSLNLWLPGIVLAALAAGAWPLTRAARAARADRQRDAALLQLPALALGLVALGAIAADWALLDEPASSHFGEVWYVTTVVWASLLVFELFAQLGVLSAGLRRRTGEFAVDAVRMQWLFLLASWILVYGIVYAL